MAIEQLRKVKGLQKPQRQTFKKEQLQKLKERVQTRQAEEARIRTLKSEASRLDQQIKNSNFLGSISNFENQYNSIPDEIRNFMTLNPNSAKNELINRIREVEKLIIQAKQKEEKYDERDDRPREKEYRARGKGYQEGLLQLKAGNLLSLSDISRYARDLGNQAEREAKAKEAQKKLTKAILKTGEITSINFQTGKVVVSGQTVRVSKKEAQKLELSSIRRAKATNVIKKAADPSKVLTVQDFQIAREFGISSSDLFKVSTEASKVLSKKGQQIQITKTELNRLQSIPNVERLKTEQIKKVLPFLSQKIKPKEIIKLPPKEIKKAVVLL